MKDRLADIDESIKVHGWGSESPAVSPTHQQAFFQKYAGGLPSSQEEAMFRAPQGYQGQVGQLNSMDSNFRRIKNEQIQKLRGLKSEYQQIRKIATDYVGGKVSASESLRSSGVKSGEQVVESVGSGVKGGLPAGREYQILQLQKRQLQIMLQGSMKKIEELLHVEMQCKKTIHELRLERESKFVPEVDSVGFNKLLKKKEKEFYDQIRGLELERDTLLTSMTGLKEKVKYLESKVSASDQELRKMLEQKRNYEQLIRLEKDKLMNLEIELRRERREFQIMEKDKNAEINMLMKLKDIKESSVEKEMRVMITGLQEEVKVKQKRYVLLLQQLQSISKEKIKQDREQQAKLVTEIINKASVDGPNQALQQTIQSILNRLNDLQSKPAAPLVSELLAGFVQDENSSGEQIQQRYRQQLLVLSKRVSEYENQIFSLNKALNEIKGENASLRTENENLSKRSRNMRESERMKSSQKKMTVVPSKENLRPPSVQPQPGQSSPGKKQIQDLNIKLEESYLLRESIENENRDLLNKISRVEFEMQKLRQESELQLNLAKKSHQTHYSIVLQDLQLERAAHSKAQSQLAEMKKFIRDNMEAGRSEIAKLNYRIESLQREKSSFDLQLKTAYNGDLQRAKKEYKEQIDRLTTEIKDLNLMNKDLQEQYNRQQYLLNENEQLKHSLRAMRIESNSVHRPVNQQLNREIMGSLVQQFQKPQGGGNMGFNQNIMNSLFGGFG